ncbi:MAG: acyl-CoA thioesterase [Eubacterium sp.]|nr:acyl-CoA thioesterase [Eubacterium sp.]
MMVTEPYVRKINYYETDQMQVVHHSNYARFLEEARLDLMEKAGLPYDLMEEKGIIIPVLTLSSEYIGAVHFGDTISIYPHVTKLSPARFSLDYEIYVGDRLVNRSHTSHGFVDAEFKPMNMRKHFPDMYKIMADLVEADS